MKVLHIITGLENGGAEAALCRLVESDRTNAHELVSLKDLGCYGAELRSSGIDVTTLDMPRGRVTVKGFARLLRLIRSSKPDVVQTWMYHADLVGGVATKLAARCPVVWGLHNSTLDPGKTSRSTRLVVRLCALVSGWVPAMVISCSQKAVDVHTAKGYPNRKMRYVPNGYDFSVFRPDIRLRERLREEWGVGPGDVLFGMVARWHPQKDHANFLRAFVQLKKSSTQSLYFVLVGPEMTEENEQLRRLLDEHDLNKNALLLGERGDMPGVMNALDVHVLSSSYGEAFPNVVIESMACGTPPVVTDVGDAGWMTGGHGWVSPPNDPMQLARALCEAERAMKESSTSWPERQSACREYVSRQYDSATMAVNYAAVWQEACRNTSVFV